MKMTFIEKYGTRISFILLVLFAWHGLTVGLQETESFAFLFPVNWLQIFSFTEPIGAALDMYANEQWWLWVEIFVAAITWMCIFFIVRGAYIRARNMEGVSMWIAFAFCTLVLMLFLMLVLRPVLAQMAIWWENWPK